MHDPNARRVQRAALNAVRAQRKDIRQREARLGYTAAGAAARVRLTVQDSDLRDAERWLEDQLGIARPGGRR